MQHLSLLMLLAAAVALHLPAHEQTVDRLYFQSEFDDLTDEVEFVRREVEGWAGVQAPFLRERVAENKAGVMQLQKTLEKYQLFVNKVTPICPGVSSFNRTEIRRYVVYLEEKQTAMVAAMQGCQNCSDLSSDILSLQNMTANYILRLNQTLDGKFCPSPPSLGESALGMVNLNLSFFRSNLAAPNWYYGSTTASDYKIYLFRRSTTYNLTSCPLSLPFVQDSEQICFDCPAGGLFNLGSQKCDVCPSDAILNVKTGACEPCVGQKIATNGSLICKECDWQQGSVLNTVSGKCEQCGEDSYVDRVSKKCLKIDCPQRSPRFDRVTQKCVACPASYVIDQGDRTKCVKTNYVGLCPPDSPFYSSVSHSCEACPSGSSYNSQTNQCVSQKTTHLQLPMFIIHPNIDENTYTSAKKCSSEGSNLNISSGNCQKCKNTIEVPIAKFGESIFICEINCVSLNSIHAIVKCMACPNIAESIFVQSDQDTCAEYKFCSKSTQIYDKLGDKCVETLTTCLANETYQKAINKCVETASTCLATENYNAQVNRCIPACPQPTQTYDLNKSQCVQTASTCLKDETYVRKSNKCLPTRSLCLKKQYYDESTFRCLSVSSSCKPSEFYDSTLIKCVERKLSCKGGQTYNEQRKKCVKDVLCGGDERFNFEIEACEKKLIICREGKEYFDKVTSTCQKYQFVTSPYVSNLIYSTPIQKYVEFYETSRKLNPNAKDCPLTAPYAVEGDCVACPKTAPYFDLANKKCISCANYESNSRRCVQLPSEISQLQRKKKASEKMSRMGL